MDECEINRAVELLVTHWRGDRVSGARNRYAYQRLAKQIEQIAGVSADALADLERRRGTLRILLPGLLADPVIRELVEHILYGRIIIDRGEPNTNILFLSANPDGTDHIRVDRESRRIEETLELSEARNHFHFNSKYAVRINDLERHLLDHDPHIFHFSGHGKHGAIFLEGEYGLPAKVECKDLARFLGKLKNTRLVILSACYTALQAEIVACSVPAVVAMTTTILDEAASDFAACLYQALARKQSLQDAFDIACLGLDMRRWPSDERPTLLAARASTMFFGPKD